jgi:hypothetical protein
MASATDPTKHEVIRQGCALVHATEARSAVEP